MGHLLNFKCSGEGGRCVMVVFHDFFVCSLHLFLALLDPFFQFFSPSIVLLYAGDESWEFVVMLVVAYVATEVGAVILTSDVEDVVL